LEGLTASRNTAGLHCLQVEAFYTLELNGLLTVYASVEYPCPQPLCNASLTIAEQAFANITLPSHLNLTGTSISPELPIGTLKPGETVFVSWQLQVDDSFGKDGLDHPIVISAQGFVGRK
jgi:hypothetical protein